ncbi:hypothetical protein ABZ816_05545 [Actinosynnema sp. NPDC047251]|uniref:Putative membrane protein n=1 Tax=Saccharothrix espanaensis (strain ATCC 51144 / DSM 44229 / JCM 9112 / NBRC 15066 / NRRL 15764) TaxID=1179773 RepID=K0JV98_SACES|nr:hypothetical protein [Saccharothrix espanaensis]CCH28083.1 putative membrane protein [Saccharothrix espanaensis DSM 44229]
MTAPSPAGFEEPEVVRLAGGLPGWVLRAAIGVVALAVAGVLYAEGVMIAPLVLYVGLAAVTVAIPASAAVILLVVYPAVAIVVVGGPPVRPGVLALVALTHLLHVLSAYAALIPTRSRIHLKALRPAALRYVLVQAGVLVLAALVVLLSGGRTDEVVEVVAVVCAVGLVAGAVALLRRRS